MPFYLREDSFQEAPYLLSSTGKQYLISRGSAGELLVEAGAGSIWGKPRPLPQQGDRYCAALDANHLPHLIVMDQGNFYHLILSPEQASEQAEALLFYREESKECGHFLFTADLQGGLHFVCLAVDSSAGRWWLLHHRFSGGAWEEPRVIDFGSGASDNYGELAIDRRGLLHLVYCIAGAGQSGLYYRYFDPENTHWSKAFPLSAPARVEHPSITVDAAQNLHVIWRTFLEDKYFICYRFMGGTGWKSGGWKPETVISPGMAEPPLPFLGYHSGEPLIAWLEGGALLRYRFSGDCWEGMEPQNFKQPLLIRSSSFSPEKGLLNYRMLVENSGPSAGASLSSLLPAEDDNMEGDFNRLQSYSGKMIGRISDLSTAKVRLEEEVKSRGKEMLLLSQQSEKNMRRLRKDLDEKDGELKKLQESFDRIIAGMKQKIEKGSQIREAERKRYLDELQGLKKERRQIESILQEREKTISRLEARIREQQYQMGILGKENEMLVARVDERWNPGKFLRRILLHKKPQG